MYLKVSPRPDNSDNSAKALLKIFEGFPWPDNSAK